MSFLNTVFLEIIRTKKKTIILFVVFTLIFAGELTSLVLLFSARSAEENTLKHIGATVTWDLANYSSMSNTIFSDAIIDQITEIEHVIGANQKFSDFAMPENFENSKDFIGENPFEQPIFLEQDPEFENCVVIEGDTRVDLIDLFRRDQASLISGHFPTEDTPGAVISQQIASLNGISLGDTLVVSAYEKELTLTVVGIYHTKASFEVTKDNIIGEAVFAHSPYNRIYTDIQTASNLFEINKETLYVDIYIDDPNNVQSVGERIKTMDIDWSIYRLINTTATIYNDIAANIKALSSTADLYICFVSVFAAISLILVTSLWAERFQYEAGIYLAMGATKWRTIFHLTISSIIVALPAFLLASLMSKPLADIILLSKLNSVVSDSGVYSQFLTGLETTAEIAIVTPNIKMYAIFAIVALCVVAFSCFLPICTICKLKPREILLNK